MRKIPSVLIKTTPSPSLLPDEAGPSTGCTEELGDAAATLAAACGALSLVDFMTRDRRSRRGEGGGATIGMCVESAPSGKLWEKWTIG